MRTSSSLCGALPHLLKSEQASRERAGATIVCLRNPKRKRRKKQNPGESLLAILAPRPWMSVRLMTALASAPIAQLLLTVLDANTQITQNTNAYVQTYTRQKPCPTSRQAPKNPEPNQARREGPPGGYAHLHRSTNSGKPEKVRGAEFPLSCKFVPHWLVVFDHERGEPNILPFPNREGVMTDKE